MWHQSSTVSSTCHLHPIDVPHSTNGCAPCTFVSHHAGRIELKWHLCMSMSSFDKLLSYIRTSLEVDSNMAQLQGGVIIPEILLYCVLHYLAGGSYIDIFFSVGISKASFYHVIWKMMYAIVQWKQL